MRAAWRDIDQSSGANLAPCMHHDVLAAAISSSRSSARTLHCRISRSRSFTRCGRVVEARRTDQHYT
eukprot:scaffold31815_cov118-Isochrysis_galbana.AAC.14